MDAISRRASSLFITVPALALGVPLLVTALVYKQRDLSILMLLVLCVAGGAKLWTTFGHRGTQCRTGADKKMVFPGNRIELTLTLTNTTFLPLWVRADVPLNGLRPAPGEDETHLTGESGLWHDSGRFQWDVTAPRRGVFRPGPIGLTCGEGRVYDRPRRSLFVPENAFQYLGIDLEPCTGSDKDEPFQKLGIRDGKVHRNSPAHGVSCNVSRTCGVVLQRLSDCRGVCFYGVLRISAGLSVTGEVDKDNAVYFVEICLLKEPRKRGAARSVDENDRYAAAVCFDVYVVTSVANIINDKAGNSKHGICTAFPFFPQSAKILFMFLLPFLSINFLCFSIGVFRDIFLVI